MTASDAIARSISHDEIVTIDYDADVYDALVKHCDGCTVANGRTEFWGEMDGAEYRVHMIDGAA